MDHSQGQRYACAVGEVASMHALLLKFGVHMRSWRVASTNVHCAVGDIANTHAQLARL